MPPQQIQHRAAVPHRYEQGHRSAVPYRCEQGHRAAVPHRYEQPQQSAHAADNGIHCYTLGGNIKINYAQRRA